MGPLWRAARVSDSRLSPSANICILHTIRVPEVDEWAVSAWIGRPFLFLVALALIVDASA